MPNRCKFTYVRNCALLHPDKPGLNVKVVFVNYFRFKQREVAYWMSEETYDAIPLMDKATVEDYRKLGRICRGSNTNIYSDR